MKKNKPALIALLLSVPLAALAQNAPPPASPPPAQNDTQSAAGQVDNSVKTALDYNFNHQAQEGTAAAAEQQVASALADRIKALDTLKTPGLDNPETRARFETFLSLPPVSDADITAYFDKISQIQADLDKGDSFSAWKLLYAMSEYKELDAGISVELANRIQGVWDSDQAQTGLARQNDKLRDQIDTSDHNADMIAEDLHQQDLQEAQKNAGKGGGGQNNQANNAGATNSPLMMPNADPTAAEAQIMPQMSGAMQRKMELTDEYLKMLEARADIKLNELRAGHLSDQDKADFANYIKDLYNSHRYYHVIIAADFYRVLFNVADSDLSVAVNNQPNTSAAPNPHAAGNSINIANKQMGINGQIPIDALTTTADSLGLANPLGPSDSDHPLSISEEVTDAYEINNRVKEAVEVFKYKAGKGQIAAAADQLQEAFLANEYHPDLKSLQRDDKEKVGDFLDKLDVLKNQLEVRDFEQVNAQLDDIKKVASDFDATKALALVNDVKIESELGLGRAKFLAEHGQLDDAYKAFQTAGQLWPGNPDLQTSASMFFHTEDVQTSSTADFDRLVQEQNYREIFEKQLAFAPAVHGDATREQQLKDALTTVQKAEMAAEKANMLVMNGDVDGAWETIELAVKDWPDDTKLNKLLASLSERGADFVSAIDKARDAEAKKELGYSLTWYVNAQSLYPASTIANDGIDRLSKQILSPDAPADSSSPTGTPSSSPSPASTPSAAN